MPSRVTATIGVTSTLPTCARFSPNLYAGLQLRPSRQQRRMPGSKPVASSEWRRRAANRPSNGKNGGAGRNVRAGRAQPAPRSPMNSWPRSTVRCRTRRPMRWRGVTAWCALQSQNFPLISATIGLFRITDGRPIEVARREFAASRRRALGAVEFPPSPAGPEGRRDRGRSRAIRARQTSVAAGAYAGQRRQRHHRRDQFRDRRSATRNC